MGKSELSTMSAVIEHTQSRRRNADPLLCLVVDTMAGVTTPTASLPKLLISMRFQALTDHRTAYSPFMRLRTELDLYSLTLTLAQESRRSTQVC